MSEPTEVPALPIVLTAYQHFADKRDIVLAQVKQEEAILLRDAAAAQDLQGQWTLDIDAKVWRKREEQAPA